MTITMARFYELVARKRPQSPKIPLLDEEKVQSSNQNSLPSSLWVVFCQVLGFLWLGPIIALLVLNFTSYTIGPSAWCFRGQCSADSLSSNANLKAEQLDKDDHNTLGALQFVAKGLELWFDFVAANLTFNVATWLANRHDGLPLGLLSASVEFADPRSMVDVFYSARRSPLHKNGSEGARSKFLLGLFVALLAFMCILANLMGPATAALVLPTLQWKSSKEHAKHTFRTFNLSSGPLGDNVFPECSNVNLSQGLYSCNADAYAASLDSWVDLTLAGESQSSPFINGSLPYGLSQEGDVLFTFNTTHQAFGDGVMWAPNRQVLREISDDLEYFRVTYEMNNNNFHYDTDIAYRPGEEYRPYTNSLQTILKRQGPILGAYGGYYAPDNISTVQVGPDQSLRCYNNYTLTINMSDSLPQYTKCIRVGTGWAPSNKLANFTIVGLDDKETTFINLYFSDKAAYYNSTWNPELIPSACLVNQSSTADTRCPWSSIFAKRYLPPFLAPVSFNILTIEISMPNLYPGQSFVLEMFTLAGYNSTYSLDTSPSTDPIYIIQVDDIPNSRDMYLNTTVVDPDWFLAAWSVDQSGFLAQNRSAASALVRGLKADFGNTNLNDTDLGEDSRGNQTTSETPDSPTNTNPPNTTSTSTVGFLKRQATVSQSPIISTGSVTTPSALPTFVLQASSTVDPAVENRTTSYTTGSSVVTVTPTATTTLTPDSDEIIEVPADYYDNYENDPSGANGDALYGFLFLSYLQALSMVDYSKDEITPSNTTVKDPNHPKLHYYAMVHVWAYGINSRNSYLGVVVACAGMVCVVLSTILGLVSRRKQRSLTEIIFAALEHKDQGELVDISKEEYAARLRYTIKDEDLDGRLRFHHVDGKGD